MFILNHFHAYLDSISSSRTKKYFTGTTECINAIEDLDNTLVEIAKAYSSGKFSVEFGDDVFRLDDYRFPEVIEFMIRATSVYMNDNAAVSRMNPVIVTKLPNLKKPKKDESVEAAVENEKGTKRTKAESKHIRFMDPNQVDRFFRLVNENQRDCVTLVQNSNGFDPRIKLSMMEFSQIPDSSGALFEFNPNGVYSGLVFKIIGATSKFNLNGSSIGIRSYTESEMRDFYGHFKS